MHWRLDDGRAVVPKINIVGLVDWRLDDDVRNAATDPGRSNALASLLLMSEKLHSIPEGHMHWRLEAIDALHLTLIR